MREPELKELVREASAALARLDAERLEELARCCQALNRNGNRDDKRKQQEPERSGLARQAREAAGEFVVFTRVLEATRANLDVLTRLRAFEQEQLEYGRTQAQGSSWARPEATNGNN
jgi:hypothetical protein